MDPQDSATLPSPPGMSVSRYASEQKAAWDEFVRASKNGTFLFLRDYMDYMQDRIEDCSLIARDAGGKIASLLPGHLEGDTYRTHGRLTYGGLVTAPSTRLPLVLTALDDCLTWLSQVGVKRVYYKTVPHTYHRFPAEEDRYALCLLKAAWVRSGMLAVISRDERIEYQERRRRTIRKARQSGLSVCRSTDFEAYWHILRQLLQERYGCEPVHTLEEIERLAALFPENIQLYACFAAGSMLAGIVVYVSDRVARAQYIASSAEGRKTGAVDVVIDHLIHEAFPDKRYIDLGTSDENGGLWVNSGLMEHKEGFGARSVSLDQYLIDLSGWEPGSLTGALR